MVEHRRGLGRGLSALLEETEAAAEEPAAVAGVRVAPIELLRRNPDQPRRTFPDEEIDGLAASIREKGLLQPILVRPAPGAPGEFQIVAGERRWRAAQRAGLREAPVIVRELDDAETLEIAILENVQREDLNPVEEAGGYRALIERFGRTQEAVAQVVGKSRSHIANTLRLLSLPDVVQTMLVEGKLSAGHARAIMTSENPTALAMAVVEKGLNVRDTENLARQVAGRQPKPTKSAAPRAAPTRDADTLDMENHLSEALGLRVELIHREGQGEVRVHYQTLEQLDEICRRLMRS
jgi:ParB family chromosome partitioning protein